MCIRDSTCFTYLITYDFAYVIAYPYAWTLNFEMCLQMQLRSYQPPIPNASQASASSQKYDGRWMCKTEASPTGLGKNFGSLKAEIFPGRKWSISYLWEHSLVLEHRIPIWIIFNVIWIPDGQRIDGLAGILKSKMSIFQRFSILFELGGIWNSQNHYFYKLTQALRFQDKTCPEENRCNPILKSTWLQVTRLWNSQNHYLYKRTRFRTKHFLKNTTLIPH